MAVNGFFAAAVARNRGFPVYGTLFAGLLVALGGGMVRDVLLNLEPAAIANWIYIPAVIVAAAVGALTFHRVVAMPMPALILSGVAWGLLITIGVQKGVDYDVPVASAILLGVLTTTAGGIIVDGMAATRATVARQAHWTATALVIGSAAFWVVTTTLGFWPAVVTGVVVTTLLRVISVKRDWPSPLWPGQTRAETSGDPDTPEEAKGDAPTH
jgi:uncharacterized membrane protein YeiH